MGKATQWNLEFTITSWYDGTPFVWLGVEASHSPGAKDDTPGAAFFLYGKHVCVYLGPPWVLW